MPRLAKATSVAIAFPILLFAALIADSADNPNNGTVSYRATRDTMGNQDGVEIKIDDPDGIARYSIFRGIQRPGLNNQEDWGLVNCNATKTKWLGAVHLAHDHVVTYLDCEEGGGHSSMWGIQPPASGYPDTFTVAERISFGDGSADRSAASERQLRWIMATTALVLLSVLLSLIALLRTRRP